MENPELIVAFDQIVLAKLRFIGSAVGAGKITKALKRDGVYADVLSVRQALSRLASIDKVEVHHEWGDMVPRWSAAERFTN